MLAIGGIISMALGSLMLFDSPEVGFRVSWWVIAPTVGATAGLFLFVVTAGEGVRERAEALKEPMVKRAMEVLGAQLVDVDEGFATASTPVSDRVGAGADSEEA